MESLVSTAWLAEHLGDPDLVVVDSSWHMPASGRSGRDEYLASHIPGARFLDIDEVSDHSNPAPHMLPSAAEFGAAMERLGIGRGDRIVVYDNSPLRTAARGWFTLRHFGARNVAILDGGLQKWVAEGRPTESGEPQPRRHDSKRSWRRRGVHQAADPRRRGLRARRRPRQGPVRGERARAPPRSRRRPHPRRAQPAVRPALQRGWHLQAAGGARRLFAEAGLDPAKPFIASCGSGVTATSLIFAAHLLGSDEGKLYDGSWSEWGADLRRPRR